MINSERKKEITELLVKHFGKCITENRLLYFDDDNNIVKIDLPDDTSVTFDILEKISKGLNTKKIFIDYEASRCYSEYTFDGSSCSIRIEL